MRELKVAVLGGGISGLSLAYYLKKVVTGLNVTLIEKTNHAGGWIKTYKDEAVLFEQGPRGCRSGGTGFTTLELVEQLSLNSQLITSSSQAKTRFLYTRDGLTPLPKHPLYLLTSKWRKYLLPILKEPFQKKT